MNTIRAEREVKPVPGGGGDVSQVFDVFDMKEIFSDPFTTLGVYSSDENYYISSYNCHNVYETCCFLFR